MAEPVRLAKRVAAQLNCSRREAEQYIDAGLVRVDGQVVDQPEARVADAQQVALEPGATLLSLVPVTILLHKPARLRPDEVLRLLRPDTRWTGDDPAIRPVRKHFLRLEALLPLPEPAEGLAVFSQDGRIVRKLTEDANTTEQEVIAEVAGTIAPDGLARLAHGLAWNSRPLPPIKVSWQNETRLRFAMKGVMPGQLPWMCEQVGLRVVNLRRIRIGRVPMAALAAGQWRYLGPGERF